MAEFLSNIRIISDNIATTYNVEVSVFFVIYLLSFIPFYLGYFLIVFGTSRRINWKSVLTLKLKGNLQWSSQSKAGLYIHLIGRVMPYVYITIWGRDLPWWLYLIIVTVLVFSIWAFIKDIASGIKKPTGQVSVQRKDIITDQGEVEKLWQVYNETFEPINKMSPCRQSFDHKHFVEVLVDQSVRKYILYLKTNEIIGIAFITNNFVNTPWISEEYFKVNYPIEYSSKLIYYFMGLAIDSAYRGNKFSIFLIEGLIDDLPPEAIMGFDHSKNVNPLLHHFTRIIKQSHLIERNHIDRQHYHVVQRKK